MDIKKFTEAINQHGFGTPLIKSVLPLVAQLKFLQDQTYASFGIPQFGSPPLPSSREILQAELRASEQKFQVSMKEFGLQFKAMEVKAMEVMLQKTIFASLEINGRLCRPPGRW